MAPAAIESPNATKDPAIRSQVAKRQARTPDIFDRDKYSAAERAVLGRVKPMSILLHPFSDRPRIMMVVAEFVAKADLDRRIELDIHSQAFTPIRHRSRIMSACCPKFINFMLAMALGAVIFAAGEWLSPYHFPAESRPTGTFPVAFNPDATSMGKSVSIATGWIDDAVEGVFILDHLTGNLQCWIMNSRSGEIGGIFRTNVLEPLGIEGRTDLDYVIATGRFDFSNFRKGNLKYADCICYVGESTAGKIVGFSFTFDPTLGARGTPQTGDLTIVSTFPFRDESQIRD